MSRGRETILQGGRDWLKDSVEHPHELHVDDLIPVGAAKVARGYLLDDKFLLELSDSFVVEEGLDAAVREDTPQAMRARPTQGGRPEPDEGLM